MRDGSNGNLEKKGEVVGYQGRHCWKQKNQKFD